jgi:peptide/nickel transport system substrate-binding protein
MFKMRQRQVGNVASAAEKSFDSDLIGRFDRFWKVKRFALGWLTLVLLLTFCTIIQTLNLGTYYQTAQPTPGGIYNEGIVGTYSNANPLFATGAVDVAMSRLIFAGLLKYNDQNQLVGDLASSYSVDPTGKHYTVTLKPGLTWQDGKPLTANDVVFTYHLVQNPDVGSPLAQSWQGIAITAPNPHTVDFVLRGAFSAFSYSLTTGILPEHILANIPASQMRSATFNTTKPIGAGPFAWQAIQSTVTTDPNKAISLIALKPFAHYAGGKPKLDGFVIHTFGTKTAMINGFQKRDINAMSGLNHVPAALTKQSDVNDLSFSSTAAVMSFFKTSSGVLADAKVRQALVEGTDTAAIIHRLDYTTKPVDEPFLSGQLGYDTAYAQAHYDVAAANATLDADGWIRGANGMRSKAGQALAFHIYAEDLSENHTITDALVKYWKALGANVTPVLQSSTDFQTTLEFHSYDALLYGTSIGVDPDVFAYWDSSQADIRSTSRLNFSEYNSATADASLEAGRTRLDPVLRAIKYKPFLQAWQADAPALGLYQPRFLYVTRGPVYGLTEHTLNSTSDRYNSVANWEIHTTKVTN